MSQFTAVLERVHLGEANAAEELFPLIYEELRQLAAFKMAHEERHHTLQPTALVHEAWLKLSVSNNQNWRDRSHFFAAAAEAMRRILIDCARRKSSLKRGADQSIEELNEAKVILTAPSDEVLSIHEALDALAVADKTAAEVVKLRYFVGLTIPEIAEVLNLSARTADRHWSFARAWLKREIVERSN